MVQILSKELYLGSAQNVKFKTYLNKLQLAVTLSYISQDLFTQTTRHRAMTEIFKHYKRMIILIRCNILFRQN